MFCPEKRQVEICLLKFNLEEIENELIDKRLEIPKLDAENEQKHHDTIAVLSKVRALNTEIENLNQENDRLTAKHMQLKRRSKEVSKALERDCRNRSDALLKQEERDTELEIRKYEDKLRELAHVFRSSRTFYEDEITNELERAKEMNLSFVNEERKLQCHVSELKQELNSLRTDVPDDIRAIIGLNLDEKLKSLSDQCETLHAKRKCLLKNRSSTTTH